MALLLSIPAGQQAFAQDPDPVSPAPVIETTITPLDEVTDQPIPGEGTDPGLDSTEPVPPSTQPVGSDFPPTLPEAESSPERSDPIVQAEAPSSTPGTIDEAAQSTEQAGRAAVMAADSPTSSTPVTMGPMPLIVNREYTGTGHNSTSQCGINSNNTELFPDGNLAGAPADDSPEDQYACHRDSIGYSLEFNFGSTTLTEPYKVQVDFDISDQAGTTHPDYRPYDFPSNAGSMCASSGMYNGKVLFVSSNTMRCEFEFLPGVAGTVKLPTLNFNYDAYYRTITDRFNPRVILRHDTTTIAVPDVPKTVVIAAPGSTRF